MFTEQDRDACLVSLVCMQIVGDELVAIGVVFFVFSDSADHAKANPDTCHHLCCRRSVFSWPRAHRLEGACQILAANGIPFSPLHCGWARCVTMRQRHAMREGAMCAESDFRLVLGRMGSGRILALACACACMPACVRWHPRRCASVLCTFNHCDTVAPYRFRNLRILKVIVGI